MIIKILIADDNRLFRDILAIRFREISDIEVVAKAADGLEVLEKVGSVQPDIVLMDIRMPGMNGIETTQVLSKDHPEIKVIALTTFNETVYIKGMIEAKARGYILKDSTFEQLVEAIRQVYAGKKFFSPDIEGIILEDYLMRNTEKPKKLTERESKVLKLLAEGRSTKEISKELFISIKTVGTHKQNIYGKLCIDNMAQLMNFAIKNGVVSL